MNAIYIDELPKGPIAHIWCCYPNKTPEFMGWGIHEVHISLTGHRRCTG